MAVSVPPDTGTNELEDEDLQRSETSGPPYTNRARFQPPPDTQHKLTISDPAQSFATLNWIDENQRRINHEGLKRQVRSHVRRGIHTKQRRLNAAARPRPLHSGPRRIVQRGKESKAELSILSDKEIAPEAVKIISQQPVGYMQSVAATPAPLIAPFRLGNHGAATFISSSQPLGSRISETFQVDDISSQRDQPHSSMHLARQQFKNSNYSTPSL